VIFTEDGEMVVLPLTGNGKGGGYSGKKGRGRRAYGASNQPPLTLTLTTPQASFASRGYRQAEVHKTNANANTDTNATDDNEDGTIDATQHPSSSSVGTAKAKAKSKGQTKPEVLDDITDDSVEDFLNPVEKYDRNGHRIRKGEYVYLSAHEYMYIFAQELCYNQGWREIYCLLQNIICYMLVEKKSLLTRNFSYSLLFTQ
jgi:hypothetical protein